MHQYKAISGAFVQLRVPKNPTPKQAEIIARRVEWLENNPGKKYPLDLRQDIIDTKLYQRNNTWRMWKAHFRELKAAETAKDAEVQTTNFTPLMALAEVAATEQTKEHPIATNPSPQEQQPMLDEGNEPAVKDDALENSSNAMMEPPKVIIPRMLMESLPPKGASRKRIHGSPPLKLGDTKKRNDGLGFMIRNNDPALKLIPGTGLLVRVKRDGKRLPGIWWCKECEGVYSIRSKHLKKYHPAEFEAVMRQFDNSPHAVHMKAAQSKRWKETVKQRN